MAFPPRDWIEADSYPIDDVVEGYRGWRPDDPVPGDNHSDGYRWGWANARRDKTGIDDGFSIIRRALIANTPTFHTIH